MILKFSNLVESLVWSCESSRKERAMRGRSDGGKKKPVIVLVCIAAVVLVFVYLFFGSSNHGASAIEYGRKLGLTGDDDVTKKDEASSTSFYVDDDANGFTPRSFPVSSLKDTF